MVRKYLLGEFVIDIDFDEDIVFEERLASYIADRDNPADINMCVKRSDEEISVKRDNLVKLSDITYFYTTDSSDIIFYYDMALSKIIAKLVFSKDYRNIDICMYELKKKHGVEDNMFMFNVIGTALSYAALMHQSFVFHSSSICYNGVGIAFSAVSGTGKSTHTKLWLDNFPGTYILNDDTPTITLGKDGIFYICGTPWAGTTGINKNSKVPLKALVFLERGQKNEIIRISSQEAIKPFFEGIRTPLTDRMFSNCLDTLNKLFSLVPIYRLKCNMNPEAAIVAYNGIFGSK